MFTFVSKHIEMFVAYVIVKMSHVELSICCITFAYMYNKLFIFISLHNN